MLSVIGVSLILTGALLYAKPHEDNERFSPNPPTPMTTGPLVYLFAAEQKKVRAEGKKCHTKTMMSRKADETVDSV